MEEEVVVVVREERSFLLFLISGLGLGGIRLVGVEGFLDGHIHYLYYFLYKTILLIISE